MPKIVSRSAVSSSTEAQPTKSSTAPLRIYYCICGEFILVIDKLLSLLPRRQSDNAIIVCAERTDVAEPQIYKLNAKASNPIIIKRTNGLELQYRFNCARCTLPVAYQTATKLSKSNPYLYILPGSLTQIQGQIPKDAFELQSQTADSAAHVVGEAQ